MMNAAGVAGGVAAASAAAQAARLRPGRVPTEPRRCRAEPPAGGRLGDRGCAGVTWQRQISRKQHVSFLACRAASRNGDNHKAEHNYKHEEEEEEQGKDDVEVDRHKVNPPWMITYAPGFTAADLEQNKGWFEEEGFDDEEVWDDDDLPYVPQPSSYEGGFAYMDDVTLKSESTDLLEIVPAPDIPQEAVELRQRVEQLTYALKDDLPGPCHVASGGPDKDVYTLGLLHTRMQYQDPFICLPTSQAYQNYKNALGLSGARVDLDEIYYSRRVDAPDTQWVHAWWTLLLPEDESSSTSSSSPSSSQADRSSVDDDDNDDDDDDDEDNGTGVGSHEVEGEQDHDDGNHVGTGRRKRFSHLKKPPPPPYRGLKVYGETVYSMQRDGKVDSMRVTWTDPSPDDEEATEVVRNRLSKMVNATWPKLQK